jgi:mannose-6-phosphate isomerase-like protein (cupin superfamily)
MGTEPHDAGARSAGPAGVVVHADECRVERWAPDGPGTVTWRTLLSGDRTPTDSLTVGIAEVAPGAPDGAGPHRHAPAEIYAVLAGEGVVVIDGVEHPVRAGSAVFIPGGAWHAAHNTGSTPLRVLYTFAVDSFSEVVYEFAESSEVLSGGASLRPASVTPGGRNVTHLEDPDGAA